MKKVYQIKLISTKYILTTDKKQMYVKLISKFNLEFKLLTFILGFLFSPQ